MRACSVPVFFIALALGAFAVSLERRSDAVSLSHVVGGTGRNARRSDAGVPDSSHAKSQPDSSNGRKERRSDTSPGFTTPKMKESDLRPGGTLPRVKGHFETDKGSLARRYDAQATSNHLEAMGHRAPNPGGGIRRRSDTPSSTDLITSKVENGMPGPPVIVPVEGQ